MRTKMRIAAILAGAVFFVGVCTGAALAKQEEIWDMLKDDHGQVKKTLGQMRDTADPKLLNQLQQQLAAHMQFEEQNIYPVLQKNQSTSAMAIQSENEHQLAKQVLNKLVQSQGDRTRWAAYTNELNQLLTMHVNNEEDNLFKEGKRVISKDQARQLGAQYAQLKTQYKAKVQPQGEGMQQQQPSGQTQQQSR